jgi:hypothetical protein
MRCLSATFSGKSCSGSGKPVRTIGLVAMVVCLPAFGLTQVFIGGGGGSGSSSRNGISRMSGNGVIAGPGAISVRGAIAIGSLQMSFRLDPSTGAPLQGRLV